MLRLNFLGSDPPVDQVLCLGAHGDDIEIGCSGTILSLAASAPHVAVTWVVFSSDERRIEETRGSAAALLEPFKRKRIVVQSFRDGFFPYQGTAIKEAFEELKDTVAPDLIFAPYRRDLHQDHRLVSELTWNTFRNHLILEYEIPKYDGDLGAPNVFVPLDPAVSERKIAHLLEAFPSQRDKPWFSADLFRSLMRLRGMECNAPGRHAEAFYASKLVLG